MMVFSFVPLSEIERIRKNTADPILLAQILADVFRLNALSMIMEAGSGHIGTSFSCMDIITWLWTQEMSNPNGPDGDIYFSSKGHDAPALYSLLIGLGKLPYEKIHTLRRLGGLPGHPDISTPYMIANTGSLGMGISKARGMARANRLKGKKGRFYVLTGDGELQEGQIWESLQPTANQKFSEITVIVDRNQIQSDTYVKNTSNLGDLEAKFKACGWEVARCDGHDFAALAKIFANFKAVKDRPQILLADTVKGKGVSFMEKVGEDGLYKFHSGAPSIEHYSAGIKELLLRINGLLEKAGQAGLEVLKTEIPERIPAKNLQKLVAAYGDELVKIARERKDIIAADADLVFDTGLIPFKQEFPDRYVECGIAEQDMVSFAGGLALRGILPVVHSFACFLAPRANEQIFNNATEKTKIIYTGSLAGLLPGMPGHSHQMVRDISALGSIPGLTLLEPSCEKEARLAIRWAVEKNSESTYIRLVSIPVDLAFDLPKNYALELGRGVFFKEGKDLLVIAYGPVMLNEAIKAAKILEEKSISVAIMNFPWLNRVDRIWLKQQVSLFKSVVTIDNHFKSLGQGTMLGAVLSENPTHPAVRILGVDEIPVCGQNEEVLKYHGLDAESLAENITNLL